MKISDLTPADADLQRVWTMLESSNGLINSLRLIIDGSFEARQPECCFHMFRIFGKDCIRTLRTHAKFMLVRSPTHNIVARTSMNLNSNPRLENIEISESLHFAEFFQTIVDEIFSVPYQGKNQTTIGLDNIPDTFPYKEVSAKYIPLEHLREPGYSHTLKKL